VFSVYQVKAFLLVYASAIIMTRAGRCSIVGHLKVTLPWHDLRWPSPVASSTDVDIMAAR